MTPMKRDVLQVHCEEQCAGEMLFVRDGPQDEEELRSEAAKVAITSRGGGASVEGLDELFAEIGLAPTMYDEKRALAVEFRLEKKRLLAELRARADASATAGVPLPVEGFGN